MSFLVLLGCGDVEVDQSKINLLELPVLLKLERGLEEVSTDKKVLFKKHLITKMGTEVGELLFVDGDYYKVYWGRDENIKDESVKWEKSGTVSPTGIEKLKRIMARDVPKYVNKTPASSIIEPVESTNWWFKILVDSKWFFNTDPPISTREQQLRFGRKVSFVRKINRTISTHLALEVDKRFANDKE